MSIKQLGSRALFFSWFLQLLAAVILLQTAYYKFAGAEESVFVFKAAGLEPWGRYLAAGGELIAALMLLVPRTAWAGSLIGILLMSTAVIFHITTLGIEVMNDAGSLFYLALTVWVASVIILSLRRARMITDIKRLFK